MSKPKKKNKKQILAELTAEKEAAQQALKNELEKKDALAAFSLNEIALPHAQATLEEIAPKVEAFAEKKAALKELLSKGQSAKRSMARLKEVEITCQKAIYESKVLAEAGFYAEAKEAIAALLPYANLDFGTELSFCKLIREIIAWVNVDLSFMDRSHMENPDKKSAITLLEAVKALPVNFHFYVEKERLLDRAYEDVIGYELSSEDPTTYERLVNELALYEDYEKHAAKKKEGVVVAGRCLHALIAQKYNELTAAEESMNGSYETALALFELRHRVGENAIESELFLTPKDEKEFKLAYIQLFCEKSDLASTRDYLKMLTDSLSTRNEESMAVFADLLLDDYLAKQKQEELAKDYASLPLSRKIELLAKVLSLNPNWEKSAAFAKAICSTPKPVIDLEEEAASLSTIRASLQGEAKKEFERFLRALLRSPKAHKIKRKSNSPDLHALFGDKVPFQEPVGKKAASTSVIAWSKGKAFWYWTLVVLLPILLAAGGGFATYWYLYGTPWITWVAIAPFALLYVFGIIQTYQWAGHDERYSALVRRIYFASGLWKAALAIVCFLLPSTLSVLQPFIYTLMCVSALELILGSVFFKDYRKCWNFILGLPLCLAEIASIVLLVLRLMGKI